MLLGVVCCFWLLFPIILFLVCFLVVSSSSVFTVKYLVLGVTVASSPSGALFLFCVASVVAAERRALLGFYRIYSKTLFYRG